MLDIQRYLMQIRSLDKKNLRRVGDLVNIEGPLLSVFQHIRNQKIYLFDWIESQDYTNRWLIYRIEAYSLKSFIDRKISYRELFSTIKRQEVYFTDIDSVKSPIEYKIFRLSQVPIGYEPDNDFLFDTENAKNLEIIKQSIDLAIGVKNPFFRDGLNVRINHLDSHLYEFEFTGIQIKQDFSAGGKIVKNKFPFHVSNPFDDNVLKSKSDVAKHNRISEFA